MYENNFFQSHFVIVTISCSSQYPNLFHLVPKQCLLSIEISQWNAQSATKWWWRRIWQGTSSLVIVGLYFVPNVHISVQRRKKTWITTLLSITLLRIQSKALCVLYAWRSFRVSIIFNNTRGESMELQQKLEQNRVKSLKKF